ncbi:hypothetical protein [Aquiflexum gelatinilyticum]|uniref:hypothetical protein n=1 Tax=Aquiflexum gelatinilyticum TaxID=2961943 RepID=UPI002169BBCA|nr:hypothetical protein [Aquiflexum gelatinilyticum]MCS4433071.1 hypothetical protein [Aquiflexum gelatinilyticum]
MKPSLKIYLLFFMFCSFNLFGQDLIITNSKEELKTKIIEIEELLIKYKKFDFQDGPIYSIKKSEVFLIIYSNGTRETFNEKVVESENQNLKKGKNVSDYEKEDQSLASSSIKLKSASIGDRTQLDNKESAGSNLMLFNKGDKLFGIGIGTGILLGNSGGVAKVSIPYGSTRFDKIHMEFGENMAAGGGLFASYHSYSIGILGSEVNSSVISGGLSGTFYYGISEKLSVGAGLRILYVSFSSSNNYGYAADPVGSINLNVFGAAYYKVAKKLNLFSELSSGISNVNLGVQFHL